MNFFDILLAKKLSGSGGGGSADLETKTVEYTQNTDSSGDVLTPSAGKDGFSQVTVKVNVPQPTGSLSITSNDTYDVTQYAEAVVAVPKGHKNFKEGTKNVPSWPTGNPTVLLNVTGLDFTPTHVIFYQTSTFQTSSYAQMIGVWANKTGTLQKGFVQKMPTTGYLQFYANGNGGDVTWGDDYVKLEQPSSLVAVTGDFYWAVWAEDELPGV